MHRRGVRVALLFLLLASTVASAFILLELDRRSVSSIVTATRGLDSTTHSQLWAELGPVFQMRWITVGVAAALLLCGVIALTPRKSVPVTPVEPAATVADPEPLATTTTVEPVQIARGIDLTVVAGLCTDLARLTTPDALPQLLERSARALNASGLVLWVGVGDRLVPVMGHGYPPQVMSRLQPALRTDDTAAAAAWRTAEPTIVTGTDGSNGAIAAPLLGVNGCVGVLAFEMDRGREHDSEALAAAALIAAQLATAIPAPAAESSTDSPQDSVPDPGAATQVQTA